MEAVLEQNNLAELTKNRSEEIFGKKIGVFAKIFGCRHKRLSRPFSDKNSSYCACLECGARKHFDAETLRSSGSFYYPPVTVSEATWAANKNPR